MYICHNHLHTDSHALATRPLSYDVLQPYSYLRTVALQPPPMAQTWHHIGKNVKYR